jgi:hypothetical protein
VSEKQAQLPTVLEWSWRLARVPGGVWVTISGSDNEFDGASGALQNQIPASYGFSKFHMGTSGNWAKSSG